MVFKDTAKSEWIIHILTCGIATDVNKLHNDNINTKWSCSCCDRISWAAELARNLVHGMVVLVVVGELCKMEKHCLCKVVFGRDESGRGRELLDTLLTCREVGHQECAHLVGNLLFTLRSRKGGSFSSFAVRSSPNGILLENSLLSVISSSSSYSFHTGNTKTAYT